MFISLPGVLERAADRCETARDSATKQLGFSLRELLRHLRLVRAAHERIGELFETWVDNAEDVDQAVADDKEANPTYEGETDANK